MFGVHRIRVRITGLLTLLALSGADRGLADNRPTAFAIPLEGITIDGRLDDWPKAMPVYPVRENTDVYGRTDLTGTDLDTSADFSPAFRVGYSVEAQRIYVAIEVTDDKIQVVEDNYKGTDAGEVYLSGRLSAPPIQYYLCPPGGSYFSNVSNPGVHIDEVGHVDIDRTQSRGVVGRVGPVTTYEWALQPLGASLEDIVTLRPGLTLGLNVVVVDKDTGDDTPAWISWKALEGKAGRLVLGPRVAAFGSLALTITDSQGTTPLAGVWVELWQQDTKVLAAVTDQNGTLDLNPPEGDYTLKLVHRGYHTQTIAHQVKSGPTDRMSIPLKDLGSRWHVDDDAATTGDGSAAHPFQTIQAALQKCSKGDTVQLAPGTYQQPLELISHVTILGAGVEETRLVGEAHWGLGLRPFITYYEHHGKGLGTYALPGVVLSDFTLDGGDGYPVRSARDVSDLLAAANIAAHGWVLFVDPEDVEPMRALLERQPDLATARIYAPDAPSSGSTLLHRVVRVYADASDAEYEIAQMLIEHGADVNAVGGQARGVGETALGFAAFRGNARLVELYLAHGGDPNRVGLTGATPVDACAHEGSHQRAVTSYIPTFEKLVEAGGRYDLGHLVMLGHTERLVADLDRNPAQIHETIALRHQPDEYGTALHEAADNCDIEVAELLLERGATINALDSKEQTPLQRARNRDPDDCQPLIQRLLDRGAEVGD